MDKFQSSVLHVHLSPYIDMDNIACQAGRNRTCWAGSGEELSADRPGWGNQGTRNGKGIGDGR